MKGKDHSFIVYAYLKGVRANGLKLEAVVRGVNDVNAGSNNSIRTRIRSRVEWKPGRLGEIVNRSTIICSSHDGLWSRTERSDLPAPLLDRPSEWSEVIAPTFSKLLKREGRAG